MKNIRNMVLLFIVISLLVACGSAEESEETKTEIKLGTSPGPYSELFIDAIQPILEKEGYTIEKNDFTELLQADIALDEGSIDLNVDQHTAYYENFNTEKKADLTKVTAIPTVPTGIFPGRKSKIEEVDDGDVIGIPKDPSNAARAYAILQKAELITLKDDVELIQVTKNDIIENKHNLDIQEMDSAQIPRALKDIDYGVIPGSIVYASDVDPESSLFQEDILKELELVAVVRKEDEKEPWAEAVKEAYKSEEFKTYMEKENAEGYWFIPEEIK